jgi:hypothetical protein
MLSDPIFCFLYAAKLRRVADRADPVLRKLLLALAGEFDEVALALPPSAHPRREDCAGG